MWKRYETWTYGLKVLAAVLMLVLLPPLGIAAFFAIVLTFGLYILPVTSFELSNVDYNNIGFVSFVVFGPYYLGKEWGCIEELAKNIRSEFEDSNDKK